MDRGYAVTNPAAPPFVDSSNMVNVKLAKKPGMHCRSPTQNLICRRTSSLNLPCSLPAPTSSIVPTPPADELKRSE